MQREPHVFFKKPLHILLVEDDAELRQLIADFLCSRGLQVTVAERLSEAAKAMQIFSFHIILMDIMLPDIHGLMCFSVLPWENRETKKMPVIFLSACASPEERLRGLQAGGMDYVTKPFEPEELLLRIQRVVENIYMSQEEVELANNWYFLPTKNLLQKKRGDRWEKVHLSKTEKTLLDMLQKAPNNILKREDIESSLGYPTHSRRLDVLIARLRQKMCEEDRHASCLQSVRGLGYKLCLV